MAAGRGFEELAAERDLGIVEILKAIRATRRAVSSTCVLCVLIRTSSEPRPKGMAAPWRAGMMPRSAVESFIVPPWRDHRPRWSPRCMPVIEGKRGSKKNPAAARAAAGMKNGAQNYP